jgi:hypothetical protein
MKPWSLLPLCALALTACASRVERVSFVPSTEAAWFKFPYALPETERQALPGSTALAIQLAMDGLLPRGQPLPRGASPQDICLRQRQSYDVEAAPAPDGRVWVRVSLSPGACTRGGPLPFDSGTYSYAVDIQQRRIVPEAEMDRVAFAQPELPEEGRVRLESNVAASVQLAMEDFLSLSVPSKPVSGRAACLDQWESYDVTTAALPAQVVLVRFEPNSERCVSEARLVDLTTYAIEVRTLRVLSVESHPRPPSKQPGGMDPPRPP